MMEMTRRQVLCESATVAAAAGLSLAAADPAETRTETARKRKIVIAGAHPDDPESACAGTMALYADAGHEVVSMYLTRGEAGIPGKGHEEAAAIRSAEAEEACRILGARPVFVGQIDGATEVNAKRYDEIKRILEAEKPGIVVTHWPIDTHRDHRVISVLVYDAWLRMDKPFELYYFEVETGHQTQLFQPTHYIDITSVEPRKRQACLAHKSQRPERGFYALHENMHRFRGYEGGVQFAEAFVRHSQAVQHQL
jgi:LmbE family N-acetylglucosaminyl deacetylase